MVCSFCGDEATGICKRKHRDWTIISPSDLKPADILIRDGKIYAVSKVRYDKRGDAFHVKTGQGRTFVICYPELPILVKRLVECGWPKCDLHCGKCMRYAESEERRERLLR
jgi:hypothetical protein